MVPVFVVPGTSVINMMHILYLVYLSYPFCTKGKVGREVAASTSLRQLLKETLCSSIDIYNSQGSQGTFLERFLPQQSLECVELHGALLTPFVVYFGCYGSTYRAPRKPS